MFALLDRLSWSVVLLLVVTLGLAPFVPEPHLLEKLRMLSNGTLTHLIDIFDLVFHGLPWLLLAAKIAAQLTRR